MQEHETLTNDTTVETNMTRQDSVMNEPKTSEVPPADYYDDDDDEFSSSSKKKRQRRSYSCGSCKLLKIKCDLQIPCSSCIKFKRVDKCLKHPPRPPSQEELNKIKERKMRSYNKKLRLIDEKDEAPPAKTFTNANGISNYGQRYNLPALPQQVPLYNQYGMYPYKSFEDRNEPIQEQGLARLQGIPNPNMSHSPHVPNTNISIPYLANNQHTNSHLASPHINSPHINSPHLTTLHLSNHQHILTRPHTNISHHINISNPHLGLTNHQANFTNPHANLSIPQSNLSESSTLNLNLNSTKHPESSISLQLISDSLDLVDLSIVDLRRIKRLLPNSFKIFEQLQKLYLKSENIHIIELMDHSALKDEIYYVYTKILSINDEDLSKNIQFSIIEVRSISLLFLILANGLIFDSSGLSNFLIEPSMFKPRIDIINDWIKLSKYLKLKILKYDKITDIIFLINWYFIIKNYYTFDNIIIENYLEYNNLLNYVVLNNEVLMIIDDPEKDDDPKSMSAISQATSFSTSAMEDKSEVEFPKTAEFELLAKYWMQLRLVEIEFAFFQYKGSSLSSNQLKSTIVPHQKLLYSIYGNQLCEVKDKLMNYYMQIWRLYYKRSKNSTSMSEIIKSYLNLYGDVLGLIIQDVQQFLLNNAEITPNEVDLLINNQTGMTYFLRWLSFIRIETNYFPSLRYMSYLTTVMNCFNHFNLIDNIIVQNYDESKTSPVGSKNLLDHLILNYRYHYIKPFYCCLIYQSLFLFVLQGVLVGNDNFKIDLNQIHKLIFLRFEETLNKFVSNESVRTNLNIVKHFQYSLNFVCEIRNELKFRGERTGSDSDDNSGINSGFQFLATKIETIVTPTSWDILINFYFGSHDNLVRYLEKVWDLFDYLKVYLEEDRRERISITSSILFDDDTILSNSNLLTGFEFNSQTVDEYVAKVVEPKLNE
jgi:hypothetical protein